MNLDVVPSYALTMPQADANPYVGAWEYVEVDSGDRKSTRLNSSH